MKTKFRLRRSADFRAVRAERAAAGDEVLQVQLRPNSLGHARVGVVVPKRLGNAVARNRSRRRVQALVRGQLPRLGPYDLVLLPGATAGKVGATVLADSMTRALTRLGATR
ncbi:MAG TPA: ribonuclease P protein component [Candidatus Dormibacteraeota bacterium]